MFLVRDPSASAIWRPANGQSATRQPCRQLGADRFLAMCVLKCRIITYTTFVHSINSTLLSFVALRSGGSPSPAACPVQRLCGGLPHRNGVLGPCPPECYHSHRTSAKENTHSYQDARRGCQGCCGLGVRSFGGCGIVLSLLSGDTPTPGAPLDLAYGHITTQTCV